VPHPHRSARTSCLGKALTRNEGPMPSRLERKTTHSLILYLIQVHSWLKIWLNPPPPECWQGGPNLQIRRYFQAAKTTHQSLADSASLGTAFPPGFLSVFICVYLWLNRIVPAEIIMGQLDWTGALGTGSAGLVASQVWWVARRWLGLTGLGTFCGRSTWACARWTRSGPGCYQAGRWP